MSKPKEARSINLAVSLPQPCVLIVDDEKKEFLDKMEDFFRRLGYEVHTALTPEEATPLLEAHAREHKYQFIITDENFKKLSSTKGHEFVLTNRHLFGKAKTIIVSGAEQPPDEILKQLEGADTPYIEKNDKLNESLKKLAKEDIKNFVREKLAEPSAAEGGADEVKVTLVSRRNSARPFSEETLDMLKRSIIKWLMSRDDLDTPVFNYDRQLYTARQMVRQIEDETEAGRDHIMMLLAEFEYSQENREDDPPRFEDDSQPAG